MGRLRVRDQVEQVMSLLSMWILTCRDHPNPTSCVRWTRSVQLKESIDFYQDVLGFVPIRRPGSFNFDGAWLFGFGIGIHLLQSEDPEKMPKKREINPKDNHISFQCDQSMEAVEKKLKDLGIQHVRALVEEGGVQVEQLFFHDPDGFMIEICNCDNLPVIPLVGEIARSCSSLNLQTMQQMQPVLQPERAV
ncbi:metallothiol transferase FosB [Salix suchowensis]|nr:metallothiol transferase FosB [Salix suchowensis]